MSAVHYDPTYPIFGETHPFCGIYGAPFATGDMGKVTCRRCKKMLVKEALIQADRLKATCAMLGIDLVIGFPKP